ncbi:MAG: rhomboid family intramembrane serine protease [Pseudomonadota bacterium]
MHDEDLRVVYESANRAECADRALVLAAVKIPYRIIEGSGSSGLVVPAEYSAEAVEQLMQYDEENPRVAPEPPPLIHHFDPLPGLVLYALVVSFVAWAESTALFATDWKFVGRVDGDLIRDGEWWRTITALTLHSSFKHYAGNMLFGCLFGLFAGRLLGSGVAWLLIVVAAAIGNTANTLLLESTHRAIGASTAVFAALGLVAGFVWRGKLMKQDHWAYRAGPIVGGFALLMFTGTGGPNTDVGAHLMGFLAGLLTGILMAPFREKLNCRYRQGVSAALVLIIIAAAWALALLNGKGAV